MPTDLTRFIACDRAAAASIVKSRPLVVAVGDLDATETVSPMTLSERCRA